MEQTHFHTRDSLLVCRKRSYCFERFDLHLGRDGPDKLWGSQSLLSVALMAYHQAGAIGISLAVIGTHLAVGRINKPVA
jgi:hypothetical protein